jgi:hypothetical protein
MRDFRLQKRIIFTGLAILLAADAVLAYYDYKMSAARQDPQRDFITQKRQLELLRADVKRASDIRTRIPEVLKSFDQFEETLPPAGKGYSVISQEMGDIARETHLLMEDTKFHEKELMGRNLNELEIEATVTGDYAGIVRFLNRLQRSKNVYIVDSLEGDSQNQVQGAPGGLKVNLRVRTYFRKA